jgi:hypothetical protein
LEILIIARGRDPDMGRDVDRFAVLNNASGRNPKAVIGGIPDHQAVVAVGAHRNDLGTVLFLCRIQAQLLKFAGDNLRVLEPPGEILLVDIVPVPD